MRRTVAKLPVLRVILAAKSSWDSLLLIPNVRTRGKIELKK